MKNLIFLFSLSLISCGSEGGGNADTTAYTPETTETADPLTTEIETSVKDEPLPETRLGSAETVCTRHAIAYYLEPGVFDYFHITESCKGPEVDYYYMWAADEDGVFIRWMHKSEYQTVELFGVITRCYSLYQIFDADGNISSDTSYGPDCLAIEI